MVGGWCILGGVPDSPSTVELLERLARLEEAVAQPPSPKPPPHAPAP